MYDFNEQILELISETEGNIYDLERMIFTNRYKFLEKDFKILSKQSIVILYSLWEGFVQEIFRLFLEEINRLTSSYFELKDSFMVSQIEKNFKQFNEYPQDLNKKKNFHKKYFDMITQPKHELKFQVDVKNNVGLEVLNNLLDIHGIGRIPEHWVDKGYAHPNPNVKDLLDKFLDIRNNTAHGNAIMTDIIISHSEFEKYKNLIICLMREIGRLLMECTRNRHYLKQV